MVGCPEEVTSQHFRGRWGGFGPVEDDEIVTLAVFERTSTSNDRLTDKSFSSQDLRDKNQSVARNNYVTLNIFNKHVIASGQKTKGSCLGVASASAKRIRAIRAQYDVSPDAKPMQALCVLDRVERGDFSGHAVLGFIPPSVQVAEGRIGKLRRAIMLDLAEEFGTVRPIKDQPWPGIFHLFTRRLRRYLQLICGSA